MTVPRWMFFLPFYIREPLKIASHVGWVKPRRRRTQQNHIVRRVSLRFTHPTFELLEVPITLVMTATAIMMISTIMTGAVFIMLFIAATFSDTIARGAQHSLVIGLERVLQILATLLPRR